MSYNGVSMVSSFDTWHGLGLKVAKPMTADEAKEKSGIGKLAYAKFSLQSIYGDDVPGDQGLWELSSRTYIATHGEGYIPADPSEVFDDFKDVVNELGGAYISAGILDNYKKLWSLAEVPNLTFNLGKGDNPVKPYLFNFIGYNGTMGRGWSKTLIKVQCQNTFDAALREDGLTSFRQTKNRLARMQETLQRQNPEVLAAKFRASVKASSDLFMHLASVPSNKSLQDEFVKLMFPATRLNNDKSEKITPVVAEQRQAFISALDTTPGAKSTEGTLMHYYDALTTVETHAPNMRKDTNPLSRDVLSGLSQQRRDYALKILTGWAK